MPLRRTQGIQKRCSSENAMGTKAIHQHRDMTDAIQKWQNNTVFSKSRSNRLNGAVEVIRLASEQHDIIVAIDLTGQYRLDWALNVAIARPDDQPLVSQLRRPPGSDQKTKI